MNYVKNEMLRRKLIDMIRFIMQNHKDIKQKSIVDSEIIRIIQDVDIKYVKELKRNNITSGFAENYKGYTNEDISAAISIAKRIAKETDSHISFLSVFEYELLFKVVEKWKKTKT